MMEILEMKLKGIIACPVCGKEFVFAYADSRGHASVPCIRCHRIILVDYDKLQAVMIPPKRRRNLKCVSS